MPIHYPSETRGLYIDVLMKRPVAFLVAAIVGAIVWWLASPLVIAACLCQN